MPKSGLQYTAAVPLTPTPCRRATAGASMEAKIKIGDRILTPEQSEIIRIAIDRWSYDEEIDVGSEDHARVRELKAMLDKECGKG